MWNRDSMTLWVAAGAALVLFLQSADPPTLWGYSEWLQFAAFVLAWGAGKLDSNAAVNCVPSPRPVRSTVVVCKLF
jgi:hypothetical protein